MANFFERMFGTTTLVTEYETKLQEAAEVADKLTARVYTADLNEEHLRESVRELSLYLEDLNWIPVDGWEEDKGFSIETIKRESNRLQSLLAVNPTIKKAINARVGYIHGRGVTFEGTNVKKLTQDNERNAALIFSETAKWRMEAQLATDGNIWTARHKGTGDMLNIPLNQIGGWVADENDPTRVNYWLREYTYIVKNFSNGVETPKHIKVFYPAHGGVVGTAKSIDGIPIDRSYTMVHLAANRQTGWVLGIPDILAAMFWAKGHKELFEAGTAFVKAQGRFASKVTSKSQAGAQRTAAAVASQPRRDEETGAVLDIGGTAVMSGGLDMQLMGKMNGTVNFKDFDPVAGLIAVGLGIPLSVLLGTSDGEEKSLEQTTVDEMKLRQDLWSWYFRALLAPNKIKVVWPKIKTEPTYRLVQSLEISNKSVTLSREELRGLTLEAYGISGDPADLPDIEENSAYLMAKAIADNAAENAADAAEQAAELAPSVPEQGVDAGIGKLSTGADSKDSRNNKSDRNTKNE